MVVNSKDAPPQKERLPLQPFIDRLVWMSDQHPKEMWSKLVKEAAERLQEFKELEEMLS